MSKKMQPLLKYIFLLILMGLQVSVAYATSGDWGPTDYFGTPNYANSPRPIIENRAIKSGSGMRKFVDGLPGLGSSNQNNLGQYIPIATPGTFLGDDYYEIEVKQYSKKMHSNLINPTTLRGYHQIGSTDPFQYLGPMIIATSGRPVRVKFVNNLPPDQAGDLFLPVDTSIMGAGTGPLNPPNTGLYSENRAELHLHGGVTPWISDGTPHQWITPVGETTTPYPYLTGVAQQNVPDMPNPGAGAATYYYTNAQSARLMFAHDHSYGITRLNVYAGEVLPYLLTDSSEENLINTGILPGLGETVYRYGIPLIIQDKTFIPPTDQLQAEDPTWIGHCPTTVGSLWFPHVYMPNQNPADPCGCNDMGRWDYGPWFWPPVTAAAGLVNGPVTIGGVTMPGTPNPSLVPEAFMDTPVVNGCAYPNLEVQRKPYRFRILNGCNDRFLNLQLYWAESLSVSVIDGGSGYTQAPKVMFKGDAEINATGVAIIENGVVTGVEITSYGSGYTQPPAVLFSGGGTNVIRSARAVTSLNTEVKMVPACAAQSFPPYYPTPDSRAGGFPDPATSGPEMIQLGTEGGFLPHPVVLPNTPIGYQYNRRDIVVLNVLEKTLFMGPAERADVIIDFSEVPANVSYVILYNDAPAPVPAFDPRYDYYTNNSDLTSSGGAPATITGYGPNTRTIMRFHLNGPIGTPFNLAALQTALPTKFAASQPTPIVPESAYSPPYPPSGNTYSAIFDNTLTFTEYGSTPPPNTVPMLPKAIQELFELNYGRMNAVLGSELAFTNQGNQTTVPLAYRDPPVENLDDNEVQLWKITHNGVDTHAMHFHLFNVQLINRVGWDGTIRPPDANELGWKETVRMNPLEDTIIALRPITAPVPPSWTLPLSNRSLDPTMANAPPGPPEPMTSWQSFDPLTGAVVTIQNRANDFGEEYVWHCHLLGHEENDMMRPMTMNLAPGRPTNIGVASGPGSGTVTVSFTAPAFLGTLPGKVISYLVTSIPAPFGTVGASAPTATGAGSSIAVTGLTPGVSYTFVVQAISTNLVQSVRGQPSYVSASIPAP